MERVAQRFPKGSLRSRYPLFTLFFFLLIPLLSPAQDGDEAGDTASSSSKGSGLDGKALFENNCATCHHPVNELQAPPLKGAAKKWEEAGQRDLLYKWVRNPNEVANMGNDYVDDLIEKWKPKYGMMNARNVSNEEIDAILAYADNYKPPKDKGGGGDKTASGKQVAQKESDLLFWFIVLGIVFLIIIFSLNGVRKSLLLQVRHKEGTPEPAAAQKPIRSRVYDWMTRHKALTSLIVIFLVLGGLRDGWNTLMGIGVYKGYQPEQPIKFSHKLHAGKNEIDCQYCHSSVKESKYPTIPSAMTCMNCHKAIQEGPKHGKKEIAKIYDAVGWDPEKAQYSGDKEPIKWVKVHELPDLAYFNHSQHTDVAGLECKECHGEVRKMEVIKQKEKLTMGWCISCHNKKEVKMEENGYYQEILDRMPDSLHKKYLNDEKITVRELGGWECAKCHY